MKTLDFEIDEILETLKVLQVHKVEDRVIQKQKISDKFSSELYPLYKNYPNGSEDYYLKLKSQEITKKVKVFCVFDFFGKKYHNFLKSLNVIDDKDYNFVITNSVEKILKLKLKNNAPIVYINCRPGGFLNKEKDFYFYDNKKMHNDLKYYLDSHKIKHMYRRNSFEIVDVLSKIALETRVI